jgi:hypothetical protein
MQQCTRSETFIYKDFVEYNMEKSEVIIKEEAVTEPTLEKVDDKKEEKPKKKSMFDMMDIPDLKAENPDFELRI